MRRRIEAFIASGGLDGSFDALALDLFTEQYETVALYRRFCDARGASPSSVTDWRSIPAVPADAFRHRLRERNAVSHVFLSSGTSEAVEGRSRHELSTLDTYRASALGHFASMVLPDEPGRFTTLILGPTAASHPHSSLGQMFSWIAEKHAANARVAFGADGTLALDDALEWLRRAAAGSQPVLVLGVSSAITALLDAVRRGESELRLPADSRIVDTGGAKTYAAPGASARTYSPRALLKAAWHWLHVPAYLCVNEYGMTEMLSQFYDDALLSRVRGRLTPRAKVGPQWTRTLVVDPVGLEPVARGSQGLLRHFDLANVESVMAVQTLDVGREVGDGFEMLGRARGAEQRGCSELMRDVVPTRGTGSQ
jgi:hypothetical protein